MRHGFLAVTSALATVMVGKPTVRLYLTRTKLSVVRASFVGKSAVALAGVLLLSPAVWAQQASGIAGVVRDTSGGSMPGVTVEAASPALIEKVRTVVTDGEGRYNIVDLRPGTYVVTFTLAGFSTFRREGIVLTAGFTATVNAELQVGALEETITVTGEAPLVDTQNVRKQIALSSERLAALPTGNRSLATLVTVTPGLTGPADVGGSLGPHRSQSGQTTGYRGRVEGKINYDGMGMLNGIGQGNASQVINAALVEELVLETGGISAESSASGYAFNAIPKQGGNTIEFIVSGLYSNSSMQSDNLTDKLRARGVTTVDSVVKVYDGGVTVGGPIKKDRLWFFGGVRRWGNVNLMGGIFWNKTQSTPFFTPDLDRPADRYNFTGSYAGRVTWQASSKNKVTYFTDIQDNALVNLQVGSREAIACCARFWPQGLYQATWTLPATNRLLIEAGTSTHISNWSSEAMGSRPGQPSEVKPTDISILELSTNFRYNAAETYTVPVQQADRWAQRFSVTHVTGSHTYKAGFQIEELFSSGTRDVGNPIRVDGRLVQTSSPLAVSYAFLNGVPNRITQFATPYLSKNNATDLGTYVQDRWAVKRLTLNYGLRFDYFNGYVPAQDVPAPPSGWIPARSFAPVHGVPAWKDLNPRVGASYDLFGTAKTALKVSLGRYVNKTATEIPSALNPIVTSVNQVNRTWTDTNRNYFPDCDLANFKAQSPATTGSIDTCGAISDQNFGKSNSAATRWADDVRRGFGARSSNWDVTAEVQQEVRPGVSVTGGYYRNSTSHFRVTDNLAVTPEDFDSFCITAPVDVRLPDGGGYQVCGLYDVRQAKFGLVENLATQASHFGKKTRVSDFVGVNFNARLGAGLQVGGGLDTGRIREDACFVVDSPQQLLNCHVVSPFGANTQVKLYGSYPLPGDVVLSGTFQNIAGPSYTAEYQATTAQILPSLGRNLAGGVRSVTVPLIAPQTQFEARRTQLDLRLSKLLKLGPKVRLQANVDVYNALNANSILGVNSTFGADWRKPVIASLTGSGVLDGRLLQVGGQLTF